MRIIYYIPPFYVSNYQLIDLQYPFSTIDPNLINYQIPSFLNNQGYNQLLFMIYSDIILGVQQANFMKPMYPQVFNYNTNTYYNDFQSGAVVSGSTQNLPICT